MNGHIERTPWPLQPPQLWWKGTGHLYTGIKPVLGDVNGDGTEDLILATPQAGGGTAVSPALSTGSGLWLQPPWWTDRYTDWDNMTPLGGNFTRASTTDIRLLTSASLSPRQSACRSGSYLPLYESAASTLVVGR